MLFLGDAAILVACVFDRRADTVAVDLNPFSDWIDPDIDILGICVQACATGFIIFAKFERRSGASEFEPLTN